MIVPVISIVIGLGALALPWAEFAWWHSLTDVTIGLGLVANGYWLGRYL